MKHSVEKAAIILRGVIYTGWRHAEILDELRQMDFLRLELVYAEQGFVNQDGFYLTREQAAEIAFNNGQIKQKKSELFSEDVWDNQGNKYLV